MEQQIFTLLAYFIIYSVLGWIMESIYRSICERKIINTGFLKGPFCPIYGIGAIIMILFLQNLENNVILLFIMSMIVLTLWEYIVAVILEKTFNIKYWDYSNNKFNFQGRICLLNSIYWGILGVVFIKYIHNFVQDKVLMIPTNILNIAVLIVIVIVLIDTINTVVKIKNLKSTLEKIENLNLQIKQKLQELKEIKIDENKYLQTAIQNLDKKRKNISHRLYKRVYRLKKAFPAIDSKEITEILNRKIEFKKNKKDRNSKNKLKEKKEIEGK